MRTQRAAWMFLAPALIVLTLFFVLPVLGAFAMSLSDFDIYSLSDKRNLRFVAFDNYVQLLQEPLFWQSLGNTFYFVVVGVPLSIAASLGAALTPACWASGSMRCPSCWWSRWPSSPASMPKASSQRESAASCRGRSDSPSLSRSRKREGRSGIAASSNSSLSSAPSGASAHLPPANW